MHINSLRRTAAPDSSSGLVLLALLTIAGCERSSGPADPRIPQPWSNGQSAEGVLGADSLTVAGVDSTTRSRLPGPVGLAATPTEVLFVVDRVSHRVLRFNYASTSANGVSADAVLGQPDFTTRARNFGSGGAVPGANGLSEPQGAAVDMFGNLYVADGANNRVLRFADATVAANGAAAASVFGQAAFTSNDPGTTAGSLRDPAGVAVDASGNLYVADRGNNRILRFGAASTRTNGSAADAVFGQSGFTTGLPGSSGATLRSPEALAVDGSGTLYVADKGNSRVLVYFNAATKANGASADVVFGQPDLTTTAVPSAPTATVIATPTALAVDGAGTLYVADSSFNRVIVFYEASLSPNGAAANTVLGRPTFTDTEPTTADPATVGGPAGIAVMSIPGKLFISDRANARVLRFRSKSTLLP